MPRPERALALLAPLFYLAALVLPFLATPLLGEMVEFAGWRIWLIALALPLEQMQDGASAVALAVPLLLAAQTLSSLLVLLLPVGLCRCPGRLAKWRRLLLLWQGVQLAGYIGSPWLPGLPEVLRMLPGYYLGLVSHVLLLALIGSALRGKP
ncbi:hypothetical protein [Chitinilyticum litopenaei]|uniref:hypothetical protein n=1 Tax=Chitinilyticum litopenaei TaxID=1121276 RepID=UPI00048DB44C|nr:hypothetical protein [Chitinilyticum litopenaei]